MEDLFDATLDKRLSRQYPGMTWWVSEPHPMGEKPVEPLKRVFKPDNDYQDYYDALAAYYTELIQWNRIYSHLKKYHIVGVVGESGIRFNPEVLNFDVPGASFKYKVRLVGRFEVDVVYLPKAKK